MDLSYLEALEAKHSKLTVESHELNLELEVLYGGFVGESEMVDLVSKQEEYERLEAETAKTGAMLEEAKRRLSKS